MNKLGMAAGYQQQEKRIPRSVRHPHCEGVPFEMVYRNERGAHTHGDRLAGGQTDHNAADQPGPRRRGDSVYIANGHTGLVERPGDHMIEAFHMAARGDLRHHAAKCRVVIVIGPDRVRQYVRRSVRPSTDKRRSGIITARFYAKDNDVAVG